MTDSCGLRLARPDEAPVISALALRSKRRWGYDDAFMRLVSAELTFSPADLEQPGDRVEVLEVDGAVVGVFRLQRRAGLAYLQDLWVDPPAMGRGYGRRLFQRAVEVARAWGMGVMEFESDPHAEGFYLHLGAVRVALTSSPLVPGRSLPLMRYAL